MEMVTVAYEQKSVLRHLLELYQYDTSIYEEGGDGDVNDHGLFDYRYLDQYWTEEGRYPNTPARAFWMNCIYKYTDGRCQESFYNGNPALEFST